MEKGYVETVKEFTSACTDDLPIRPIRLTPKSIQFITEMVNDELEELAEATTLREQADALVDAIYYICDCAVKHGLDLDPVFEIVHGANMSKLVDGKPIKREDGKILKPKGWEDPDTLIAYELDKQLYGKNNGKDKKNR